MSEVKLGELVTDENQQRDAVHVAVIPMTAGQLLRPGDHVGVDPMDKSQAMACADGVGIVDPLLMANVKKGQRFLLWLYPNSVTGMRHHWSHPKFCDVSEVNDAVSVSTEWLKNAAVQLGVSYERLIEDNSELVCGDYINNGEHIRDIWYELSDEFWKHRAIVTGKEVEEHRQGGFTCSC